MTSKIEIFKEKYRISYEEAARDSLSFRSGSLKLIDELDDMVKWLDGIQRACKTYGEEFAKCSETVSCIAKRLTSKQYPGFLDGDVTVAISEAMLALSSTQSRALDNIQDKMNIFVTFTAHIRDVKDAKRAMDRGMERFETLNQKLSNLSNKQISKDTIGFSDLTATVAESKKQYLCLAFEFVRRVSILTAFIDSAVTERALPTFNAISAHYDECKSIASEVAAKVVDFNPQFPDNLDNMNEICEKWRDNVNNTKNNEIMEQILAIERAKFEIQGFLNLRKPDQKWSRRYFILKNGQLTFSTTSKITSNMSSCPMIDMKSYVAKACSSIEERRFCFEIVHMEKDVAMVMQAESEQEMIRWIECLEGSKGENNPPIGGDVSFITESKITLSLPQLDFNPLAQDNSPNPSNKKNQDFHDLNMVSVPSTDLLVASFPVYLNENNNIQGTCYVTNTRLCLYSSVLGPSKSVVLAFKDIHLIEKNTSFTGITLKITDATKEEHNVRTHDEYDENNVMILINLWKGTNQIATTTEIASATIMTESHVNTAVSQSFPSGASPKTDSSAKTSDRETVPHSGATSSFGSPDQRKYTLPPPLLPPSEDVSCNCKDHLDRVEVSETFPASAKEVFEHLFGDNAIEFWTPLDKMKGVSNRKESLWSVDETSSIATRKVDYTVPVNNPLVSSKEIEVNETTSIVGRQEHFCYVVEKSSATPQVPFGDCFVTRTRFCIRWQTENTCHLQISIGVSFLKSTLMKGFIRPEALKGLGESVIPISQRLNEVLTLKKIEYTTNPLLSDTAELEDMNEMPSSAPPNPVDITIPTAPVNCNCSSHLEKVEYDVVISCTAEDAFDCLFGLNSLEFWQDLDRSNGEFNRQESAWTPASPTNLQTKKVSYWMKLDNPMLKSKQFEVKSNYTCIRREEKSAYIVEIVSSTPDIPYGDCFTTETRYCITWVDSNCCRLIISSGVTFLKYTMMKAIIKINATKGLSDKSTAIITLLRSKLGRNSVLNTPDATKLELANSSHDVSVANNTTSSSPILTPPLLSSNGGKKIAALLIASFLLGFLLSWIIIKPSSPTHYLERNWNRELSASGLSKPSEKMFQFLRTHFNEKPSASISDADSYLSQPPFHNVPYYTQSNLEEYHRLVDVYTLVHNTKQDISQLSKDLSAIQKHLIWSMYYNWRGEEIESSLKNASFPTILSFKDSREL